VRECRAGLPVQPGRRLACLAALALFLADPTIAGEAPDPDPPAFPGYQDNDAYRRTQALFDVHLRRRHFAQAYRVAMRGLVWRGDKHAQYMVGYMHHTGEGVPQDPVRACAWFRLAAERGHAPLMEARDAACDALSRALANDAAALFAGLQREYGDRRVLRRLIARDQRLLRASLTRHPALRTGHLLTMEARGAGFAEHGFIWHEQVQRRIEARVDYLGGYVELGELELIDAEPGSGP